MIDGIPPYLREGLAHRPRFSSAQQYPVVQGKILGPTLLVFRDCFLDEAALKSANHLQESGDKVDIKRTHFNVLGGNVASNPKLLALMKPFGFSMIEDRPLIGGDDVSSHGYWTKSLYQFNPKVPAPEDFKQMALDDFQAGVRMCFDGAFVNEGLNGVHYLANLKYGNNSPFLKWFDYGELNQFPFQPLKPGILPVSRNLGQVIQDYQNNEAWTARLIAHGPAENPTYSIRLMPQLPGNGGALSKQFFLTSSQDSVQPYEFPLKLKPAQVEALQKAIQANDKHTILKILALTQKLALTISIFDNSGYKWSGQRDVPKVDSKNPDVANYIADACYYWTDKVDRVYTAALGKRLAKTIQSDSGNWQKAVDSAYLPITPDEKSQGLVQLPPLNQGEINPVNDVELQAAKRAHEEAVKHQSQSPGVLLAQDMAKHFRLETLPAPLDMQIFLSTPKLRQILQDGAKPLWLDIFCQIFDPIGHGVDKICQSLIKARPYQQVTRLFSHQSFYQLLGRKLDQAITDPALREKLKDPLLAHLFYEEIGRSLFLKLMTGQYLPSNLGDKGAIPMPNHAEALKLLDMKEDAFNELEPLQKQKALQKAQNLYLEQLYLTEGQQSGIPRYILDKTPNQAAYFINQLLIQRLKSLDLTQLNAGSSQTTTTQGDLNQALKMLYQGITPESAVVARYVLNKRKLGLHWRIDAMKDLGDLDAVRDLPSELRYPKLLEELTHVNNVMGKVRARVTEAFPGSTIIGEVTDIPELVGGRKETEQEKTAKEANDRKAYDTLMAHGVVDGMPNFDYLFASGHKAVAMAWGPEGEGEQQLTPSQMIQGKFKPMMKSANTLAYENFTSNHDFPTSLFGLVFHPYLKRYDYLNWFWLNDGEKGVFPLVLNELEYRSAVQSLWSSIGLSEGQRHQVCEQLKAILADPKNQQGLMDSLAKQSPSPVPYLKEYKTGQDLETNAARQGPLSGEIKAAYLKGVFAFVHPEDFNPHLTQTQFEGLKNVLSELLLEPSEIKGLRGAISNAYTGLMAHPEQLDAMFHQHGIHVNTHQMLKALEPAMNKALLKISRDFQDQSAPRWLGYQQLDYVLDWLFNELSASPLTTPQAARLFKQALYNQMVQEALVKYERIAALQIASPGIPAFYLPDLFGQVGGEYIKNMYLGCRERIRYDWVDPASPDYNPLIADYYQEMAKIIHQRQDLQVLNDGAISFPLDPGGAAEEKAYLEYLIDPVKHSKDADFLKAFMAYDALKKQQPNLPPFTHPDMPPKSPILPLIRQNGQDQVICLINFGQPEDNWDSWMSPEAKQSPLYPAIHSQMPEVQDYVLNLKFSNIPPGTLFESVDAEGQGQRFVVDKAYRLVDLAHPSRGIDIRIARTLKRVK